MKRVKALTKCDCNVIIPFNADHYEDPDGIDKVKGCLINRTTLYFSYPSDGFS